MWRSNLMSQDPGRIEVPTFLEDALPIDPSTLGDPIPLKSSEVPTSPAGLADDPALLSLTLGGSTHTFSQPNSATSSLASCLLDADLQITSRQSSGSDLSFSVSHSRFSSQDGSLSARSDISVETVVLAITSFDHSKCKSLAKVKVSSPPRPPSSAEKNTSPTMMPVLQNVRSSTEDMPGLTVRPARVLTTTLSQPGTNYNMLSGMLAEFKLKKSQSPAAGARPPPPRHSQMNTSSTVRRALPLAEKLPAPTATVAAPSNSSRPQPIAAQHFSEPEPECMVMIPGLRRKNTK